MGKGVVVTGIILSVIGIGIAGACAAGAYNEFKKYDKYKTGEITLSDAKKITIEASAGTVNVRKSDTTTSYVKYNVLEYYNVNYDKEDNELKMKTKWFWGLIPFSWGASNKSTVDVYLAGDDYDAYLELNAGNFNIVDEFVFDTLTVDVSAGDFVIKENIDVNNDATFKLSAGDIKIEKDVVVGQTATVKVSAGDIDINSLVSKTTYVKVSAGDVDIKELESDDITFKISAGDITMNINGDKADYVIDIDESAGSCYIDGNKVKDGYHKDGGAKKLDGKLSAGKATITFAD